jgi:hypothetical protein
VDLAAGQQQANVDATLTLATSVTQISIMPTSLPAGIVDSAYSAQLEASGGTGPYTWTSSDLPQGLTINATTGQITGTPTAAGNFALSAQVLDSSVPPMTDSQTYTLSVGPTVPPTTVTTTTTSSPAFGGGGGGFPAPAPTTTTSPASAPGTTTTTAPPRHPSLPPGTPLEVYSKAGDTFYGSRPVAAKQSAWRQKTGWRRSVSPVTRISSWQTCLSWPVFRPPPN